MTSYNTIASVANAMAEPQRATRFSSCAGMLEERVAHLNGLVDRCCRIADRLGGSVPEVAEGNQKPRSSGNCIASVIEQSLEDLDCVIRRAERAVERMEQL